MKAGRGEIVVDENKKKELQEKEEELENLITKFHILNDTIYDISPYNPDFQKKRQKYREKITKILTTIDLLKNEIYFLKHNPVVSNAKLDLYLGRGSIEEGYVEFDVFLHATSVKIGHVRLNKENDNVFGNIGYGLDKEYRGHHFMLQSLELLKDIMLKMRIIKPIITVEPDNLASVKTIQAFGGVLVQKHNNKELYYDTYEVDLLEKQEPKKR